MAKTVIRQGHLLPLSQELAPRSRALEGCLRLFPLPDVVCVVLCVESSCWLVVEDAKCCWSMVVVRW